MALPQFELFDLDGKLVGVFESRADAEHRAEELANLYRLAFSVDDSKWRQEEAEEQEALRQAERLAELEAKHAEQAEQEKQEREEREELIELQKKAKV